MHNVHMSTTHGGKTRITIYLDDAVLKYFRAAARRTGRKYQSLVNEALSAATRTGETPLTATQFRRILRQELRRSVKA
jgi:uncharacterized protein (DUF4415 family)